MAVIETIFIPKETANDDTVTVLSLIVNNGAKVEFEALLGELETSKSTIEVISPCNGYVEFRCNANDELPVGAEFALIHDTIPSSAIQDLGIEAVKRSTIPNDEVVSDEVISSLVFSETAEQMLLRHGIDRNVFRGRGVVRGEDVVAYLENGQDFSKKIDSNTTSAELSKVSSEPEVLPDYLSPIGNTKTISRAKKLEIGILAAGQNQLASNVSIKIRVPGETMGDGHPNVFGNLQNLLIPSLLIATCDLLKKHPVFNAFFYAGNIHYYKETHIGYAIDLGEGLTVVNLGDVSGESAKEVNRRIIGYMRQYMIRKIPTKVLAGCTFTITELMGEGVTGFTPLINQYQSGILGISAIEPRDDSMELSLTFDHRVTEGKEAARFLKELKVSVESGFIAE